MKKAFGKEIELSKVKDIEEIAGHGVSAKVDGKLVFDSEEQITENHALMMYEPLLEGASQEK